MNPGAVVAYPGGGRQDTVSGREVRHGTCNRLWAYPKCMPLPLLIFTLPGHMALTAAILLRGLSTGRFDDALKGFLDAVRGLGPVWEDRRTTQALRTASLSDLVTAMAWNPMRMLGRGIVVEPLTGGHPAGR